VKNRRQASVADGGFVQPRQHDPTTPCGEPACSRCYPGQCQDDAHGLLREAWSPPTVETVTDYRAAAAETLHNAATALRRAASALDAAASDAAGEA